MAISLSNAFSLYNPPYSSSSLSKPSTILQQFKSLNLQFKPCLNRLSLAINSSSAISSRGRFFKSSVIVARSSTSEINDQDKSRENDVEVSGSYTDQDVSSSLKSLLKVYKEAILVGDEKAASFIESTICMIEKEKNELVTKNSTLSAEINSGKEKFIRLQADFDNYRKRSEKEKLTIRSDAQGEVIQSLLPMVDNFERAKQQLVLQTDQEKKIDASYQGIYKQFVEIMRSLRVAVVATVGKPFDPALHEAIAREESQEFKEGIIVQEFCRGFLLGDRLLRPAMVKVSAGSGKRKSSVVSGEQTEPATAAAVDDSR